MKKHFYEVVRGEIASGRIDEALQMQAVSESGDAEAAKRLYVKLRVGELRKEARRRKRDSVLMGALRTMALVGVAALAVAALLLIMRAILPLAM